MSRFSLPPLKRRRSSALRKRGLWAVPLGGAGAAALALRGRILLLLRRGAPTHEQPVYEGAGLDAPGDLALAEPPADDIPEVELAESEIGSIAEADNRQAGSDTLGDGAADAPAPEPTGAPGPEVELVVDPDPAPEPPADPVPDAIDEPAGAEDDPLVAEETNAARAEAAAIGEDPEEPGGR